VLTDFTATSLYGQKEADRSRFDFACDLVRDWERALVGQTLWSHDQGIDKDVRTLLAEDDAAISVYVARDSVRHRKALHEAMADYRSTPLGNRVGRFRVFWVPADFDADVEEDRALTEEALRGQIVTDLLFNVVFERLSRHDVHAFANTSGRIGVIVGLLGLIARSDAAFNYASMAAHLGVSSAVVRERFSLLLGLGLIQTPQRALMPGVTDKGKVLLDLLAAISDSLAVNRMTYELNAVLQRLECSPFAPAISGRPIGQKEIFGQLCAVSRAGREFGYAPENDRFYIPDDPIKIDTQMSPDGDIAFRLPDRLTLG
jgi:hypothetical protein